MGAKKPDDDLDPNDPNFFAKLTISDDVLDYAFGPQGGSELPRVNRRPRKTGGADETELRGDLGYQDPEHS